MLLLVHGWFIIASFSEGVTFHTTIAPSAYLYSIDDSAWAPVLRSRCRPQSWLGVDQWECYVTLPKQYFGIDRRIRIRAANDALVESNVMMSRSVKTNLPQCDALYTPDFDAFVRCYPKTEEPVLDSCPIRDDNAVVPDQWCIAYWPDDTNLPVEQPVNVIFQ